MGTWHAYERSSTSIPATVDARARTFHESLNDYEATALIDLPALAAELSIGRVVAKDESTRLGLPAFKALGASWAIHRATEGLTGPLTIVTATDGNHGRAIARFARTLGHSALIFTPDGVHPSAVQAIATKTHACRKSVARTTTRWLRLLRLPQLQDTFWSRTRRGV